MFVETSSPQLFFVSSQVFFLAILDQGLQSKLYSIQIINRQGSNFFTLEAHIGAGELGE